MGFCVFRSFSLGSRLAFLSSRPYFRVCVLVTVFLSTETSLQGGGVHLKTRRARSLSPWVARLEALPVTTPGSSRAGSWVLVGRKVKWRLMVSTGRAEMEKVF